MKIKKAPNGCYGFGIGFQKAWSLKILTIDFYKWEIIIFEIFDSKKWKSGDIENLENEVREKTLQEETQELGASLEKLFFDIFEKPANYLINIVSKIINKK